MTQTLSNRNRVIRQLLWVIVLIGVIASLPLALDRFRTEQSSKKVEVVFDYRDLLEIANYKTNPREFVNQQLDQMKKAHIHSFAVYESTLSELQLSRRIELYDSHEAAALTQTNPVPNENFTYVLFTEKESQTVVQDMIQSEFGRLGVKFHPWSFKGQQGLVLEMPEDEAMLKPMSPDPVTLKMLKDKGFQIVARLSNRRPFDEKVMDGELQMLEDYGVGSIIVDGDSVPGYGYTKGKTPSLEAMGQLMNKHHMALAAIELLKTPQKGFSTLAKDTHYNVFRLHSFTESDADKLTQSMTKEELDSKVQAVADRFVLAVKDRNIRMILLNARPSKNVDKGTYADPLEPIYQSLIGKDGALNRIQQDGFTLGEAHSFHYYLTGMHKFLKPLIVLGSVSLIALTLSYFVPSLGLPLFVLGAACSGLLYATKANLLFKLLALGAAVCAASLAMMLAVKWLRKRADSGGKGNTIVAVLTLLGRTTVVSLIGGAFVIGLLNDIIFNLLLDQFFGVKILAYMPVLLVFLYLLLFSENLSTAGMLEKAKRILLSKISVLWIISAGVILGAGYYYLSRTGNEGQASSIELVFRSFLENTLKVRPRTKELLIGHPLFILGAYLYLKKKSGYLYLFIVGAIAQADIVGTFTHLHTPLLISAIRVVYGLIFGLLIGLVMIVVWEAVARSWNKWIVPRNG